MSDTQYKTRALAGLAPIAPAIGGLLPGTVCRWPPVGGLMRAQDTIPATSRRIVAEWSISGSDDWHTPAGTVDPAGAAQVYPDDMWRVIGNYQTHVTPGCELVAYVVHAPSGLTEKQIPTPPSWVSNGAWGTARIGITWSNGASSTGPHYRTASLPGSPTGTYTGLEPQAAGQAWTRLRITSLGRHRPPGYTTDPAVSVVYSEWSDAEITISVRGGARAQQVVVYERPISHTTAHDNDGLTSVHAMPPSLAAITQGPVVTAAQGATYREPRHGSRRIAQVAERQSERLGPRILHWSCWDETDATIWDQALGNPVTSTSTSFAHLLDSTITVYDATNPGWVVAGAHAQLARLCDPTCIARGVLAVVPVRVRVDASRAVGNGVVRVQCGLYDWVDVPITGARAVYEVSGYLESQIQADHAASPCVVWLRVLAGGSTVSVYGVSVDFGTWA